MDHTELIKNEASTLIAKLADGCSVEVTAGTPEEATYTVSISATEEASPTIIGRHGETIRAIQKILEVIFFRATGERANIVVNVNDYREKQNDRLEYIAGQAAQKAESEGRPAYLRGFSSFERRIMHEYITRTYPDLTSYSVGEGRDRRLVIDRQGASAPMDAASEQMDGPNYN